MHFNEPEEPSRVNIEENDEFQLPNEILEFRGRERQEIELIDEVIETRFNR